MNQNIIWGIIGLVIIIYQRSNNSLLQQQISELQDENYSLQSETRRLKSSIESCNETIFDAKQYEGSDYEEMEWALGNLEECYY